MPSSSSHAAVGRARDRVPPLGGDGWAPDRPTLVTNPCAQVRRLVPGEAGRLGALVPGRRPAAGGRGRPTAGPPAHVDRSTDPAAPVDPADAVADLLARIQLAGWIVDERWGMITVTAPTPCRRLQGWQLQVSATVCSAPRVVAACAPLLVESGTSFTFVATAAAVAAVTAARASGPEAGRVLAGYPASDELFRELVERLDRATVGLSGPAIPAARPYRPGGVVHYRYGSFVGIGRFDQDGRWRPCLVDPDGNLVEDVPGPTLRSPSWVAPPIEPGDTRHAPSTPTVPGGWGGRSTEPRWSVSAMWTVGLETHPDAAVPARLTGVAGSATSAGLTGAAGPTGTLGPVGPAEPAGVLIGGRYAVTTALRQAYKGGVYRARDLRTGTEVLIKEARPHVAADAEGRDARDRLGHEARVLRHLAPLGLAPRPLREFVQDDHRFLVEELLPGRALAAMVADGGGAARGASCSDPDELDLAELLGILARLADLLRSAHSVGVVVRDLSPDNVMVLPDGALRLVDLELAALRTGGPDDWCRFDLGDADPTYHAPELVRKAAPDAAADLFSLGMVALHLVCRATPAHPEADTPADRPIEERVATLLDPVLGGRRVPAPLHRLITGLLRTEPTERIGLDEVTALCAAARESAVSWRVHAEVDLSGTAPTLPEQDWAELVDGIVGHLGDELEARRLPSGSALGRSVEPCTVQHGVAGAVAVLARLVAAGAADPRSIAGDRSAAGVRSVAGPAPIAPATVERAGRVLDALLRHLLRHLDEHPHPGLPGLYCGFAGTAWALCDAGRLLGRPGLVDRAVELALRLPVVWPDPGLSHGIAGLGTALLRLWRHTYLPELRDRITAIAAHLLDTRDRGAAMLWTVDASADSVHAGLRTLGFAHGTAGIGAFLLAAGHHLGRRDLVAAAVRCGDTLLDAARHDPAGAARWPDDPGAELPDPGRGTAADAVGPRAAGSRDGHAPVGAHRCTSPAGIGGFLCQLYAQTGQQRHLDAAVAAARTVLRSRWRSGTGYCHGLAGDGDLLLDLARVTADDRYARWAEGLGRRLWALRVYRNGRAVLADEAQRWTSPGFGTGLSGQLAFLLRLRQGGHRLFNPDFDPVSPRVTRG